MKLQSSDNLTSWTDLATVPSVTVNLVGPKKFFRFQALPPAP
jgi:hypothetical protein